MFKVGFLEPKGTFSHKALEAYMQMAGRTCEERPYNSIPDILNAVQSFEIDEAIVPIENSLEGAVNATMDIMAEDNDLKIKSELVIAIRENILVKKGTEPDSIRFILSHPQPLGQCRNYISSRFPDAETRCVYSTAGAAQEVAAGNGDMAAIGSKISARSYGLEILESNIQDGDNNHTRFVIISHEDSPRTGCDKSSIVFSTENKPGSLYSILDIFNIWDINMSRIESRPAKNQLGSYIFFVDIQGHRDDQDIKDAMKMIKRKTSYFKFLGSYPAYEDIS